MKGDKAMTKEFINRVCSTAFIDTAKYRYKAKVKEGFTNGKPTRDILITRILLSDLDTTAALGEWETVKVIKNA